MEKLKIQAKNSKLKQKTQKLKQETQGFGKSTWSTCRKRVEKKGCYQMMAVISLIETKVIQALLNASFDKDIGSHG